MSGQRIPPGIQDAAERASNLVYDAIPDSNVVVLVILNGRVYASHNIDGGGAGGGDASLVTFLRAYADDIMRQIDKERLSS